MSKYEIQYENIPSNLEPDENITLWRYMSFSSLCEILTYTSIPLISVSKFNDKSEGIILKELLSKKYNASQYAIQQAMQAYYSTTYVSSWHKSDIENAAMWDRYTHGGEGVAIKTNAEILIDCITCKDDLPAPELTNSIMPNEWFSLENVRKRKEDVNVINIPTLIAKSVRYIDTNPRDFEMDIDCLENGYDLLCFFYKFADFEDESEVRILRSLFGNAFMYAKLDNIETIIEHNKQLDNPKIVSDLLPLNISYPKKLIEQIVVSPSRNTNFIKIVKSIVSGYQLKSCDGGVERIDPEIVIESRQKRWV